MKPRVKVHDLTAVIAERKRSEAKSARQSLFEACKTLIELIGDDFSGFAIVAWSRDGALHTAYQPGSGPIRADLIPTLAGDALNRHVTLDMAEAEGLTGRL